MLIPQYKGHLSNISENTLMTAVNDEGGQINVAVNTDGAEDTIPRTMQKYRARGEPWMLVVDDNCALPSLLPRHRAPGTGHLNSGGRSLALAHRLHADPQTAKGPRANTPRSNPVSTGAASSSRARSRAFTRPT